MIECGPDEDYRVYPRVCGGAVRQWERMANLAGLSPRVRGSRSFTSQHPLCPGSIPACAGEPPAVNRLYRLA